MKKTEEEQELELMKKWGDAAPSVADPWTLGIDPDTLERDVDKNQYNLKKEGIPIVIPELENIRFILKDVLAGDAKALDDPRIQAFSFDKIRLALNWLLDNTSIDPTMKLDLMTNPHRLVFKERPPTPEEFLTSQYIGDMSNTLHWPLRDAFCEYFNPSKPYRTLVLNQSIGYGKAQPLDSKIYETEKKWFYMGDARLGQKVLTPTGESKIIQLHPQGVLPVYKITLSDGRICKANIEHKWKVSYRKDLNGEKIWDIVNTKFLIENKNFRFEIPIYSLDIEAYILSIKQDGYEEQQCITIEDPIGLYVTDNGIITHNSTLTILANLFVTTHLALMHKPYRFFGGSAAQPLDDRIYKPDRKSYFFMGDIKPGDIIASPITGETEVIAIHPQGVIDCYELEFDDNRKIRCSENHKWKVKFNNNPYQIVDTKFIINHPEIDFDFYDIDVGNSPRKKYIMKLKSVKYLGEIEQQCITVSNDDGLYITNDGIITHNSSIYVNSLCAVSQKKASENLFEPFVQIVEQAPYFKRIKTHQEMKSEETKYENQDYVDYIGFSTSSVTSPLYFVNNLNYKLIANANSLLGMNIVMGSMTELSFFSEAGWALNINTPIKMEDNSIKILKDIKIGDKLAHPDGIENIVENIPFEDEDDLYEIEFDNGKTVQCNLKHLWKVSWRKYGTEKIWEVVTTKFMLDHPEIEFEIPEV